MASKLSAMRALSVSSRTTGTNWKSSVLFPDVEGGDKEIVDAGDGGGLEQELGLRSALFAGDQDLGDRGGFGIGKQAVHVAHEVAAQRNEKEDAEAAAGQADEDGLHGMGIELQDVERGQGEDGARDDAIRRGRRCR